MIQHEALPSDPDHQEVFEVPEELQLGISAFIKLYQLGEYVGEAGALDKVPNKAHAWALTKVMLFQEVDFDEEVTIKTMLLTAEKLCYLDDEGWIIMAFRDKPLQETSYVGHLSKTAVVRDTTKDNFKLYEHVGFNAKRKGVTL